MYETNYDKQQPCFGGKSVQIQYMDTGSSVLSVKTNDFFKDFQNPNDFFDFSSLDKNNKFSNNESKNELGKYKIDTPKCLYID